MNSIAQLIKIPVGLILVAILASACSGQGIGVDAGLILGGQGAMTNEFSAAMDTGSEDDVYDENDFSEDGDVSGVDFDVINMDGDVVELDSTDSDLAVADYSEDEILGWDSETVDVDDDANLESGAPDSSGSATDEFDKSYDDEGESEYNDETGPFSLPVNPAKEDGGDDQDDTDRECDGSEEGAVMLVMLQNDGETEDLSLMRSSSRFPVSGRFSTRDSILFTRSAGQDEDVEVTLVKCEEKTDETEGRRFEWTVKKSDSMASFNVIAEFDEFEILLEPTLRGTYILDAEYIGEDEIFTARLIDKKSKKTASNNVIVSEKNHKSERFFETIRIK